MSCNITEDIVVLKHRFDGIIKSANDGNNHLVIQTSASEAKRISLSNNFGPADLEIRATAKQGKFSVDMYDLSEDDVALFTLKGYLVSAYPIDPNHPTHCYYQVSWN